MCDKFEGFSQTIVHSVWVGNNDPSITAWECTSKNGGGGVTLFLYWLGILAFPHSQFFQKIQAGSTAETLCFFLFETYQRRIF